MFRTCFMAATMLALSSVATAQETAAGPEVAKPMTAEQEVLAELKPKIVGAWSLVAAKVEGRIDHTALVSAGERCAKPPALSVADMVRIGRFADGGKEARRDAVQLFRGDLAYQDNGTTLVRIDYLAKFKATVLNVARRANGRGKVFYVLDFGRAKLPVMFRDAKLGRAAVTYMVQNEALYLKCPPVPVR